MPGSPDVFNALADPHRRTLLRELSGRDYATASELAELVPVSRQAVLKHLATLERAQLVDGYRSGREFRFHLTPEPLADAVRWIADVGAEWDDRLDALGRHLAQKRRGR